MLYISKAFILKGALKALYNRALKEKRGLTGDVCYRRPLGGPNLQDSPPIFPTKLRFTLPSLPHGITNIYKVRKTKPTNPASAR